MSRTTEGQIGRAVLRILSEQPSGRASIPRLKRDLPNYIKLTEEDCAASQTRKGEEVWEQQVRNLVSHRTTEGNIIADGYAAYEPRWLTITDQGRQRIK